MAGYSAHLQVDAQDSLGGHLPRSGRPRYVYRALRIDELIGHNSVCLKARGRVLEATPSSDTITMAVENGWEPSPFIHTTTSPTAALWFACSIKARSKSGKIAKFDLRNFKGNVYDLSSQNRFLVPRSKGDFFARCFSEVLLQGSHDGGSNRLWNGILTEEQICPVQVWDVSHVWVPASQKFRDFEAELRQFSSVNPQHILNNMERPNLHDSMPYTGGVDFGDPFASPFRLQSHPFMPQPGHLPFLEQSVSQSHLFMPQPGHLPFPVSQSHLFMPQPGHLPFPVSQSHLFMPQPGHLPFPVSQSHLFMPQPGHLPFPVSQSHLFMPQPGHLPFCQSHPFIPHPGHLPFPVSPIS